ncbi:hypothetical protein VNO78_34156 [Psophocarpus tetragonolobus]|uniref:Uncharacterized protein n=1 Tax=Psophocarpus tetragonolobus TaxID=3891 RepID=A0AAN9RSC8_PSOTE
MDIDQFARSTSLTYVISKKHQDATERKAVRQQENYLRQKATPTLTLCPPIECQMTTIIGVFVLHLVTCPNCLVQLCTRSIVLGATSRGGGVVGDEECGGAKQDGKCNCVGGKCSNGMSEVY